MFLQIETVFKFQMALYERLINNLRETSVLDAFKILPFLALNQFGVDYITM